MASAVENLDWIDSISMAKMKFDKLEEDEKVNYLPTGILKEDSTAKEYCEMYKEIQNVHQGKRNKITQNDFDKKI
jgi:2-oxoglutarate ferredoxin oxidoreductase subunit beta